MNLPPLLRSEAFAEDLLEPCGTVAEVAPRRAHRPRRDAWWRRLASTLRRLPPAAPSTLRPDVRAAR